MVSNSKFELIASEKMTKEEEIDCVNRKNKGKKTGDTSSVYDAILLNESLQLIAKGTGIILAGAFIGSALAAIFPIILARFYSPAEFGIYVLTMTVFLLLVPIFSLGLGNGCSRNIAFHRGKKDYKKVKDVIVSSFELVTVSGIAASIFLFLSADWISLNIFNTEGLIMPLKVISFALPFWLIIDIIVNIFRGFDRTKESVYFYNFLMDGGKLIFIVPVVILGLSFNYIFYALVANIIVVFFIASFYFKRKIPEEIKNRRSEKSTVKKDLLVFSLPLVISGMSLLLIQSTDKFMVGFFIGEYNVGLYNAACIVSGYLNIFLVSTVFIYQPVGAKLYGSGKNLEIKELYQTITKWIFLLASPFIMFILLQPGAAISLLFGSIYLKATFPLIILFVACALRICLGPIEGSIIMFGKTRQLMYIVVVIAMMNIALNWFLIPLYGISGAAIATGISLTVLSFLELGYLYKISKIHPVKKLYVKMLTIFLSLMAVIYLIFQYLPSTFSLPAKILIIIFSYFLFFVLLIIFNLFSQEDLLIIELIEQKIGIKIPLIRRIIR